MHEKLSYTDTVSCWVWKGITGCVLSVETCTEQEGGRGVGVERDNRMCPQCGDMYRAGGGEGGREAWQ